MALSNCVPIIIILMMSSIIATPKFCDSFISFHSPTHHHGARTLSTSIFLSGNDASIENNRIDVSIDERLYRVRISRAPGIEWGTDLSFSFVYVRAGTVIAIAVRLSIIIIFIFSLTHPFT